MGDFPFGFREVVPDQTLPEKWKEITLNTGGTQSTLQDIKVPERSGGYSYKDSTKHYTRNRFIYWRICHDVLEMVEQSLDLNLVGNSIRYKFQDTPILEGLTIHETYSSIIVLVATVSSVHRLTFPHPDRIHKMDHLFASHPDLNVQSIFSDASVSAAKDSSSFHVINNTFANTLLPLTSASWLSVNEEALFALAYNTGTILLIRMDPGSAKVFLNELKQETMMPRFLSGIAGALRGKSNNSTVAVSMVLHSIGLETYLFSLYQDGHLRMWSCSRAQCISVCDVLSETAEVGKTLMQGAQNHMLRKAVGQQDNQLFLGIYLCYAIESQFCILKPANEAGAYKFSNVCTIYAPDHKLVDFGLNLDRLWAVWLTAQDEVFMSTVLLESIEWQSAVLEQPPDRDLIATDPEMDPRQAYVSYIFHPGQFPLNVITRALSIYRRSSLMSDVTVSSSVLKERVCLAVEAEIQNEVQDYELTDDDYLEVAHRCWARFYSCCVQYCLAGTKPLGLVLLHSSGVVLIKKQQFSLLRPMDALEHLFMSGPDTCIPQQFSSTPFLSDDPDVCSDLLRVVSMLIGLENFLPDEIKTSFERELYQLKIPDQIIAGISRELMRNRDEALMRTFVSGLCKNLEHIRELNASMLMLVEALTLDLNQPTDSPMSDMLNSEASRMLLSVGHLYSSHLGMSMVAKSLHQIAVVRFSMCRNLLLLQQLLLDYHQRLSMLDASKLEVIRSVLLPRTVILTQAYYIVMWACETPAKVNSLDNSIQRLAGLKLGEGMVTRRPHNRSLTLLELFLQHSGSTHAHTRLAESQLDEDMLHTWQDSLLLYITMLGQLIWPISGNFAFPEFLLVSGQHLLIQEYVRLLQSWCECNNCSRKFLLGSALLAMGEPYKAYDLLIQAANGICTDYFMITQVVQANPQQDPDRLLVLYYLKIIKMFEQQKCGDCVIHTATTAISVSAPDDSDLPTLHSVVFSHHLQLGHHEEAYHSLVANPDAARRKDCLRQLVITLFERRCLDMLAEFPYQGMIEDLERIVESRARSLDLMSGKYYNFLYSFHTKKGNLRKAASIMFEQGLRLSQETDGNMASLHLQVKCYLACLNALRLVNPKYQWIVKPVPVMHDERQAEVSPLRMSPKRTSDGEEIHHQDVKKQVEVLELGDIKREFELVKAKMQLMKHSSGHFTSTGSHLSPSELVAVLTNVGLYQTALKICRLFKFSPQSVLEGLASACVKITPEDTDRDKGNSAWDWLVENQLSELGIGEAPAVSLAWRLLESLVMRSENEDETILHKAVSRRLLAMGSFLPQWLEESYRRRNPSELLRLYLSSGRLADAAIVAKEYIFAMMGKGMERFGLVHALKYPGTPTWLPFSTIDMLLLELQDADGEEYKELHATLKKLVDQYLQIAMKISGMMQTNSTENMMVTM